MTNDVDILRFIIDIIIDKYSNDTKEIREYEKRKNLELIGEYETKIFKLNEVLKKSNPLSDMYSSIGSNLDSLRNLNNKL